jgi:hypothetical protein
MRYRSGTCPVPITYCARSLLTTVTRRARSLGAGQVRGTSLFPERRESVGAHIAAASRPRGVRALRDLDPLGRTASVPWSVGVEWCVQDDVEQTRYITELDADTIACLDGRCD